MYWIQAIYDILGYQMALNKYTLWLSRTLAFVKNGTRVVLIYPLISEDTVVNLEHLMLGTEEKRELLRGD